MLRKWSQQFPGTTKSLFTPKASFPQRFQSFKLLLVLVTMATKTKSLIIIQEVKVTRNYQITIPKAIAEKEGIKVGDKVLVIYKDGKIVIEPKRVSLLEIIKKTKPKLGEKVENTDKVIRETIDELVESLKKEYKQ